MPGLVACCELYLLAVPAAYRQLLGARLRRNSETGALDDGSMTSAGSGFVGWPFYLADQEPGRATLALYQRHATQPSWMQVLPGQHAVYLKYNQCLSDSGFQRLAAKAIALPAALIGDITATPALSAPGRVIGLVNQVTPVRPGPARP